MNMGTSQSIEGTSEGLLSDSARDEQGLELSDRQCRYLIEYSSDVISVINLQGIVVYISPSVERVLGYRPEEFVGTSSFSLLHPDDLERVKSSFSRTVQSTAYSAPLEFRLRHKDGSWRVMSTTSSNQIHNEQLKGIIVNSRDITSSKTVEEQANFQAQIIDQVQAAVVATGIKGTVIHWNAFAEQLYGWSREEVIGRPILDFMLPPENQASGEQIFNQVLHTGSWEGEFWVKRKDGTSFPAYVIDTLIRDAEGRPSGLVGVSVDITERKENEQALISSEARFRSIFENTLNGIMIADDDLTYIDANPAACDLLGMARNDLPGKSLLDSINPGRSEGIIKFWQRLLVEGTLVGEGSIKRSDGEQRDIEYSTMANFLPHQHTIIIQDITQRKVYEQELKEHAAAQTDLLRQLMTVQEAERRRLSLDIHDGPLQSLGVALMALDRAKRRLERGEYEQSERELELLRASLTGTVGEVRAVLKDLSLEILNNYGLEQALLGHIEYFSDVTGIKVNLDCTVSGRLPADSELLLYRLTQEAMANVRKHAEAQNISILVRLAGETVYLTVQDDGKGFNVDEALQRHESGQKIGLHSMLERVSAIGGTLEIVSQPGEGTTLRFGSPLVRASITGSLHNMPSAK